jgi:Lrp/AsnC family leucine-responsive transcriptional regulator
MDLPQVQEIHYVAGHDSYLLKVRETDTTALGRLIREHIAPLPGVVSTQTTIVMNTIKETARIPIDDLSAVKP